METDSNAHLNQWKHNRDFLASISAEYPDWIVTVAFYTALYAVDALLSADKIRSITSHNARNYVLMHTNRYKAINKAYHPLYGLSRTVRYLAKPAKWVPSDKIKADVFDRYLHRIEQSVWKLLDKGDPPEPIATPSPKVGQEQPHNFAKQS